MTRARLDKLCVCVFQDFQEGLCVCRVCAAGACAPPLSASARAASAHANFAHHHHHRARFVNNLTQKTFAVCLAWRSHHLLVFSVPRQQALE